MYQNLKRELEEKKERTYENLKKIEMTGKKHYLHETLTKSLNEYNRELKFINEFELLEKNKDYSYIFTFVKDLEKLEYIPNKLKEYIKDFYDIVDDLDILKSLIKTDFSKWDGKKTTVRIEKILPENIYYYKGNKNVYSLYENNRIKIKYNYKKYDCMIEFKENIFSLNYFNEKLEQEKEALDDRYNHIKKMIFHYLLYRNDIMDYKRELEELEKKYNYIPKNI